MKDMPMADEASRQQVLDGYRIVDSLPEDTYQDIVQVAASLCETPIALMSLVDRDRQWFKARLGLDLQQTDRSQAVCDHAIRSPDHLMEVPDLSKDPRFTDISVVTGGVGARFYAGMPLVTSDGVALGTVCVLDTEPRALNEAQRTGLQALARVAMRLLDERQRELQRERDAILQPAAPAAAASTATITDADTGYHLVILEVQELAALAQQQSERLSDVPCSSSTRPWPAFCRPAATAWTASPKAPSSSRCCAATMPNANCRGCARSPSSSARTA